MRKVQIHKITARTRQAWTNQESTDYAITLTSQPKPRSQSYAPFLPTKRALVHSTICQHSDWPLFWASKNNIPWLRIRVSIWLNRLSANPNYHAIRWSNVGFTLIVQFFITTCRLNATQKEWGFVAKIWTTTGELRLVFLRSLHSAPAMLTKSSLN